MYFSSAKIDGFNKKVFCRSFLVDRNAIKTCILGDCNKLESKIFRELGLDRNKLVFQEQKHTDNIKLVNQSTLKNGSVILNNDAMVSREKDLYLCAHTADCVPVMFFDPRSNSIGTAHSGWRGTINLIAHKTANMMNKLFGVCYSDIKCYLGPSIKSCCYEISMAEDERIKDFITKFGNNIIRKDKEKIFLDLSKAIKIQLEKLGILEKNIEISEHCTCCDKELQLPSYYREGKNYKKSVLSIIGVKK